MPAVLRLAEVSKRYKLGVSRISLPSVISKWAKKSLQRGTNSPIRDGYHLALRDVSFELEKGESLALIGPNGAGKSTILKLLSKITFPTSGTIEVNGKMSALIELGAGFHPDLTGRENIYLNGAILGLARRDIDQRFEDIVAFSELERFIDTPLKRYSSGMTVRLGFAVASCMNPDILLVDEVLAVGDSSFRQKCIERIRQLHKQGTSLIFVSHDLGLVKAICETAILLDGGVIQSKGSPVEIIEKYNAMVDERRAQKLAMSEPGGHRNATEVEITKVEVLPVQVETLKESFRNDRPIEIRISCVAYKAAIPASMLVRIYRSDGLTCCLMRTSDDGFGFTLTPGTNTVSVFLDSPQLSSGRYHAVAWLLDADGITGITRGASEWFQVRSVVQGKEANESVFEPPRRWVQHRVN